jgi:hypothetical protein
VSSVLFVGCDLVVAPRPSPGAGGLCFLSLGVPTVEVVREGDVYARDGEACVEYGAGRVVVLQGRGVHYAGLWGGGCLRQGWQRREHEYGGEQYACE